MSDVAPTRGSDDLRAIAERVRRQTTSADILALCDAALASVKPKDCPVCETRRALKAAAQRRWRAKARG